MRFQIVREIVAMALDSLRTHRLRSFLTILGIVIGVMTVIGMVSVIQGLNKSFLSELQSAGSDIIIITKHEAVQMGRRSEEERVRRDLTFDDVRALEREATLAKAVAVSVNVSVFEQLEVKYQSAKSDSAMILGMNDKWPVVMSLYLPRLGRFITATEVDRSAPVCVLGSELADALFPTTNPIGKEIRVGPAAFTVVGVLAKRGQMFGQSRDNFVGLPITTLMKHFPYDKEDLEIIAAPRDQGMLQETIEQISGLLRQRRKVPYGKPNDFAVMTQDSMVDLYNQLTGAAYLVMIVISSIGLLVGGIGVMNIMLVSVKERTREIGIRKAIGARSGDILKQFLIEAIVLTGAGGLIGVLVGFAIALLVRAATPLPAAVSPWSVALGLSVSAAIGLFFGLVPARKAARMDPIVSLRYE
ncbi:MAG TPA: ABC transporter permease [Candidatus Aminicenantes bacterium]|nr:ABC transporter permease [Candidatus Aminicenantes bacterium]HRY66071.1 ABC transporter permease [Candidatus Aminicenantes bacterium]HRZ72880.1 ABC transporter permease [Candidatus Aminicenantes bacterium]